MKPLREALLLVLAASAVAQEPGHASAFRAEVMPVLKEACLGCHSTEKQKGDLDLEVFGDAAAVRRNP
ncbi:MAG: c-type cytochrome domain-containing protein, partial [Verrucomicrobiota bacterium]